MRFWLDRGVDGFRIDVVHRLIKDPELRDNPLVELDEGDALDGQTLARILARKKARRYDEDWPEVHEILRISGAPSTTTTTAWPSARSTC